MRIKYILTLLILLIFTSQPNLLSATPSAGIAAIVNGEIISNLELQKNTAATLLSRGIELESPEYEELFKQAKPKLLETLIDEKLFLIAAKEQSLTATDAEVQREIEMQIGTTELPEDQFYNILAKTGTTRVEYFNKIKSKIITKKLIQRNILRKIFVTEEEISEYYHANNMDTANSVQIAIIVYPSVNEALAYGDALMKNPQKFHEVARKISVGPNTESGGRLDSMLISELSEAIRYQIAKMQEGDVSNIFSLGEQEAQVRLIKSPHVVDEYTANIDEQTRVRIENEIREQKAKHLITEYLAKLKDKAIITIK